jgi:hypothetical protein
MRVKDQEWLSMPTTSILLLFAYTRPFLLPHSFARFDLNLVSMRLVS